MDIVTIPANNIKNNKIDKSKDAFHQRNQLGLDEAYKRSKGPLPYIFPERDTLYIAGTQNAQDVYDDVRHVPPLPWSDMKQTERYKTAETYLKNNPQIKRLVGHSLGGSVVLALQRNNPERNYEVVTYGAPVFVDLNPFRGNFKVQRFKHIGREAQSDPISMFDMGAKITPIDSENPLTLHSYKGYVYDFDNHNIKPSETKPVTKPQITIPNLVNPIQTDSSYQIS